MEDTGETILSATQLKVYTYIAPYRTIWRAAKTLVFVNMIYPFVQRRKTDPLSHAQYAVNKSLGIKNLVLSSFLFLPLSLYSLGAHLLVSMLVKTHTHTAIGEVSMITKSEYSVYIDMNIFHMDDQKGHRIN